MEKLFDLSYKLHDELLNSNEYKKLKEKEHLMLSDSSLKNLIDSYHELLLKSYNDKSKELLKEIDSIKLKLDENELVINYKKAYKEYQLLIANITEIAFNGFKNDTIIDKIIKANL